MPTVSQTRRVAAWIYVVVNPIIDSLEREPLVLESGNLTWRAYLGRCETIREIQEYVDPGQLPNFDTFVAEYPTSSMVLGFREHDSLLARINVSAQEMFERLTSLREFLGAAESGMRAYEEQCQKSGRQAARQPEYIRKELARFSAEYVINNIQSLPSHYATAEFWNSFGTSLLAFRSRPEFQPLYDDARSLSNTSARLRQDLLNYRLEKSREYDVPAAPVPGLSLDLE